MKIENKKLQQALAQTTAELAETKSLLKQKEEAFVQMLKVKDVPDDELLFREQQSQPTLVAGSRMIPGAASMKNLKGIAGDVRTRAL